ncbi:synaptonemal complex protein 1 [Gymnodraco acuticeps]|uniref:Synaptonemal complex protein 1 n=1 Tax=Gymnodraco acuticeps TaxID=8218 RepID=A0A6P8TTI6_GYMAC|nr:synaptonemal complex protein 1 [Gymnodraco acuticeps]XP_034061656.1 synaptonemal complex protein 1 [Gymnodraco acuticeps]
MDRNRGFSFKLLVPSRVSNGQVSAVRPQEVEETCGDFMVQQVISKGFEKEQTMPFPNTSMVAPTKPTGTELPKIKAVSPMEKGENNSNPGQLYSKLFDEVEKVKSWKVKVDSDTLQKERRLQENKRTIETQRKAIQELQFGSESLSVKLEEQISENEDLRNKNNATRNLCNILKDTFQRSAEKMHLFESEREETHHLLMENSSSIQNMVAAFESLRVQAEDDQQEMQKVKEALLQFEDLKEKYNQEYDVKEKEVAELQTQIRDKEHELQNLLLDLHENQKHCKQLQEATNEQCGLLSSSKTEQESLLQKRLTAEQLCTEAEIKCEALAAILEQTKEEFTEMIQSKDSSLQELSKVKNDQAETLEQIQTNIQELQDSLALETKRTKELEDKLMANSEELERRNTLLGENMEQIAKKERQIKILEDELDKTSKCVESMKEKIEVTEVKVEKLTAELSRETEEAQRYKNDAEIEKAEHDLLKEACEAAEKAHEDLKEKSRVTEIKVQQLEGQLFTEVKTNKEHTFQMVQLRQDIHQHEDKYTELLANFNELHCEKTVIQQQFASGSSSVKAVEENLKVSEKKAVKLTKQIQRLEEENQGLREEVTSIENKSQEKCQETETLQKKFEANYGRMEEGIAEKEKQIKSVETKLRSFRKKFEMKLKAQEEYQKEINNLHEEAESLRALNEENCQKLLKEFEAKSTLAAELEIEVQKLKSTAAEATKNKEDTELKCQHQIADMVALMEKHKSQYDRMVEEKDAELDETKKKEMQAVAHRKSLDLELAKHKTDNDHLKQQLVAGTTEKEKLQKELADFKKEMSSMKMTLLSEARNKQAPALNCTQGERSETPRESSSTRHVFDFTKTRRTPSSSNKEGSSALMKKAESYTESIRKSSRTTPKTKEFRNEDLKTPRSTTNRLGGTSKIKSYRIRTPPSSEKASGWGKSTLVLSDKSDSSDQHDLLTFASTPIPDVSAPHRKFNIFKKIQSPISQKSPGNSLKLAAMKRMRDAGWTAVTGCDKKKKTTNDKIFA